MGLWLNETVLSEPDKLDAMVCDLAHCGYGIVRVMLRNTNFNHRSPVVVEAVRRLATRAHGHGLRLVLDCEPHSEPVAHDMGNLFPKAIGYRVVAVATPVVEGRFVAHVRAPVAAGKARAEFLAVEAAFLKTASGVRKLDSFSYERRSVVEPYDDGFLRSTHTYTEGRPSGWSIWDHLSGMLKGGEDGTLLTYVRYLDPRAIDFWALETREYYRLVLESYRDISLDGVGWDEPGTEGYWNQYICGEAFSAEFERRNGYQLADKWHLLDEAEVTPEAARVRLDYYGTLNEGLFDAQRQLISKARELFGPDILLGTHHTWQGEGGINDYRAGAVDYFRLNDNMDAGYTDCWWWDIKSVCYSYTLASSLGRLTPSGEAEVNTWDAKPSIARVDYHARLMTLMDITWFNIWYGHTTDTCMYPADYTWQATVQAMNQHRDRQLLIGKARPVAEITILHGWETVCAINRPGIASAHKAFCLNTAAMLVDQNVSFDWIDTRLLADSRVQAGRLTNALGSYRILILPYASVLPREAWQNCIEFAHVGGKLMFVGPPPELDVQGQSIRQEFAHLIQMPVLSLKTYLDRVYAVCRLPDDRPDTLDICYPLQVDATRSIVSIERECHGVRNTEGNVVYLTDLDPRRRLLQVLQSWVDPLVTSYSDTIQWRLYRDSDRSLLVCIARQECQMRGVIRWGAHEVEFLRGKTAILERLCNGELRVHGDQLEWHIHENRRTLANKTARIESECSAGDIWDAGDSVTSPCSIVTPVKAYRADH